MTKQSGSLEWCKFPPERQGQDLVILPPLHVLEGTLRISARSIGRKFVEKIKVLRVGTKKMTQEKAVTRTKHSVTQF
jgi:hypothetical protein